MNTEKPKLNKKLLLKVRDHILAEPKRLDMDLYCGDSDTAPCGTAGCIAGWTALLTTPKKRWGDLKASFYRFYGDNIEGDKFIGEKLGLTTEEQSAMFYHRKQSQGKRGAREVAGKINLILKNREKFVEKYSLYPKI